MEGIQTMSMWGWLWLCRLVYGLARSAIGTVLSGNHHNMAIHVEIGFLVARFVDGSRWQPGGRGLF